MVVVVKEREKKSRPGFRGGGLPPLRRSADFPTSVTQG